MLKMLAAALIASAAMIGTIRLAECGSGDHHLPLQRHRDRRCAAPSTQFEKQNPDIKVDLQRIGWRDARDQYLREAAAGRALTSRTWRRSGSRKWARPAR